MRRNHKGQFSKQRRRKLVLKNCSRCGLPKSADEYYLDPRAVDGHRSECKGCISKAMKKSYLKKCGLENWSIAA